MNKSPPPRPKHPVGLSTKFGKIKISEEIRNPENQKNHFRKNPVDRCKSSPAELEKLFFRKFLEKF